MATRISQDQLAKFISPEAAMAPYERAEKKRQQELAGLQAMEQQRFEADSALARLIKGNQMKESADNSAFERDVSTAERLRAQYGSEIPVNVGQASLGATDPLAGLKALIGKRDLEKPQLTPAQHEAEKKSGDAIQTYAISGGAAGMDKNQAALAEVEKDLMGKRDAYDRTAGKILGGWPGAMGIFAPTEKARMDKAQAGAVGNIKATDSNPTQALIDQTMSRVYDPRANDAQNLERIQAERKMAEAKRRQIEAAKINYDATGYATIGNSQPTRPSQASQQLAPGNSASFDQMSDEQLKQMYNQLMGGKQ